MARSFTAPHHKLFDLFGIIRISVFTAKPKDRNPKDCKPKERTRPQSPDDVDLDRRSIDSLLAINPDAIQCHSDLAALMSCYRSRY